MYKILTIKDTVRVPPKRFNDDLEGAIVSEFEDTVAGRIDKALGIILAVASVDDVSEGKIIMGDGAIYYTAVFDILIYLPVVSEVVEGTVTEITEFGAFVNFGPMDGLIHISQITEDFMSCDSKNATLIGKETRKVLKQGDKVRARVVTVSLKNKFSESKIGLTMRQPYLGKLEWLDDERKKLSEKAAGEKTEEQVKKGKK